MFQEISASLERSVQGLCSRNAIPPQTARILVALSGGADSCALLYAAVATFGQHYSIHVLHVDHQLDLQSGRWASHCQALCDKLGVSLTLERLQVSKATNLEAQARHVRYDAFQRHMGEDDILLLAHHRQDQAESLLMRMFQGRGILPMRESGRLGQGYFVRPFLSLDRDLLKQYLVANDTAWIDDPSNADTRFDRNYLRHRVLPPIDERWPEFLSGVHRSADDFQAQQALLMHLLNDMPDEVAATAVPSSNSMARVWLRCFLAHRGHYRVADASIDEFLRQQRTATTAKLNLGSAELCFWQGRLYFEGSVNADLANLSPRLLTLAQDQIWHGYLIKTAPIQCDEPGALAYSGELWLSCRELLGDQLTLSAQTLKKRFQEANIPPWRRGLYPMLVDDCGVVAIPDVWFRHRRIDCEASQSATRFLTLMCTKNQA